jgi:hypothetical protein
MSQVVEQEDAPLRFADVMEELARVRAIAVRAGAGGGEMADGCVRLEALFVRLQRQFLRDVLIGHERPA